LLEAPPESPAPAAAPVAPPAPAPDDSRRPHWLLSLFTPAPADSVDWGKGDYTVLVRGGRVESSAGSGELKKQLQMVAEGSVIQAGSLLHGAATDVGPDGFAHPVFRAGFAVSIPLPEVS
jgi:CRISPR/Cas system CSM-associated protein Csm4 (group 5 of RAMP superfamily)